MPKTYGDAITEARRILQDTRESSGLRYPDEDLIAYLNNAFLDAFRIRPDLFYPDFETIEVTSDDLEEEFAFDQRFFPSVVYYIVGMAELREDEFASDARAVTVSQQFVARLRTAEA